MHQHSNSRRQWLQQSALAFAGLTLAPAWTNPTQEFDLQPFNGNPIRLGGNENPYGPAPSALKAMQEALKMSNRYPWAVTTQLREDIAKKNNLTVDHVIIGSGSSEILGLAAQWAALQKGNIVSASPTFGIWLSAAEKLGLQIKKIPLTAEKVHDLPKMAAAIDANTKIVYVCNPNNPTGTILEAGQLKDFVTEISKERLVLLDEAYIEYTDEPSLANLVADNKNLIVARTFSKIYGLAGARIGYGLAHPDTIKVLNGLQPWSNHGGSAVSLAAARASLADDAFVKTSRQKNEQVKAFIFNELKKMNIPYINTHTNFFYYGADKYKGSDLRQDYMKHNFNIGGISSDDTGKWARMTIGTMDEMKQVLNVMKTLLT
ncbi:MAG: pyridoxal phosphate-dependent aminotransferase [Saprospiraceae bacterium]